MRPATEYLLHLDLKNLFEVFVIPVSKGTKFQFYAYPELERTTSFDEYLAQRFSHLGQPGGLVYHEDFKCYEVHFPGLHFKDPEEALKALTD